MDYNDYAKNSFSYVAEDHLFQYTLIECAKQYSKVLKNNDDIRKEYIELKQKFEHLQENNLQLKKEIEALKLDNKQTYEVAEDLYVETANKLHKTAAILNAYTKRLFMVNGEESVIAHQGEDYIDVKFIKKPDVLCEVENLKKPPLFPISTEKCTLCQDEYCGKFPYNLCQISKP